MSRFMFFFSSLDIFLQSTYVIIFYENFGCLIDFLRGTITRNFTYLTKKVVYFSLLRISVFGIILHTFTSHFFTGKVETDSETCLYVLMRVSIQCYYLFNIVNCRKILIKSSQVNALKYLFLSCTVGYLVYDRKIGSVYDGFFLILWWLIFWKSMFRSFY